MSNNNTSSTSLTWFVTGCSGGLGRQLVVSLLARGQKVAASSRKLSSIQDLSEKGAKLFQWDVTDPLDALMVNAKKIDEQMGGIDVLINSAGFGTFGTIEELGPRDDHKQFDTNVFGLLNTTRAFLPHMRARRTGTVVNLSSIAGLEGGSGWGIYCASKYAVEGLTESLHEEISPLGLRALVVEPGYFRTAFIESMPAIPSSIADYNDLTTNLKANFEAYNGKQPGDPEKGMNLLIDVVLGEGAAKGKPWVVRLLLGSDAVQTMERRIRADKEALEQWKKAASACEFDEKK